MKDRGISTTKEQLHLKHLFFARAITSLSLLLIFYWLGDFFGPQTSLLLGQLLALWLSLVIFQVALFRFTRFTTGNLLFQLISDLLLIGFVIYASGGLNSPFIFLLGLVIITAGTQARVLIVLLIAVLSAITYLIAAYSYAGVHHQPVLPEQTLHLLLQTSLFFLAGGIMALIARRYASLEQQQKQASSQHQQLQEIHSQVLSSMQEGIITLSEDLTIQEFNPIASQLLGISEQHIGFRLDSFITFSKTMVNFTHSESFGVFRWETTSRQGQNLLLTLTRLQQKQSAWLMTIVNITETRALEHQLAEQDKLAAIGQMAAMLAHEIRNPMQTISQAVELMGLNQPDSKLEHIVTNEISRLNRLVSDMLDYASPLHPHPQYINILSLIETAIFQADLKQEHQIQIDVPNINTLLDPDHLRLVLDNLIRNALRVSPEPESIQISFSTQQDNTSWVLKIRDHGPGIAKGMQTDIFQPFQTGHKQGVGLGLATVSQVCQVNHWDIQIDNHIDDGACFIISYHASKAPATNGENHG